MNAGLSGPHHDRPLAVAATGPVVMVAPQAPMQPSTRRPRRPRRFTGALRRAVEVRDRHCQHPSGCDVPVTDCDVDHRQPSSQGGITSQDNGDRMPPPQPRRTQTPRQTQTAHEATTRRPVGSRRSGGALVGVTSRGNTDLAPTAARRAPMRGHGQQVVAPGHRSPLPPISNEPGGTTTASVSTKASASRVNSAGTPAGFALVTEAASVTSGERLPSL